MTVQNRIVIGFAIPEETTEMLEFGEKNKDFIRHDTSRYIYLVKEEFYTVQTKKGDSEE